MFRSSSAQWTDPTFPTTRASARVLQRLSRRKKSDQKGVDGDRRSVSELAEEPLGEMGRPSAGGARGRAAR